jgi:hypothetical protein
MMTGVSVDFRRGVIISTEVIVGLGMTTLYLYARVKHGVECRMKEVRM